MAIPPLMARPWSHGIAELNIYVVRILLVQYLPRTDYVELM